MLVAVVTLLTVAGSASAHIPIVPVGGTTLGTAVVIDDPWKSWFYYSSLAVDQPHYYQFDASAGERIRFMVNVPIEEGDRGFAPTFVLMGPGVANQGSAPGFLETPATGGVMVIEPTALESEFEGFTPLAQYITTDLNMSAPETGTYYIAVYEETTAGRYALVTGYVEAYSIVQWITVPFMAITILMWTGQAWWMILTPMLLPLIIGLVFIFLKHREALTKENMPSLIGTMAGFLFVGSGISIFSQMIYALLYAPANWTIIASVIFGSLPLLLGLGLVKLVHTAGWTESIGKGITIIIVAVIGLFVWAGLIVGPLLAILSGLIPIVKRTTG